MIFEFPLCKFFRLGLWRGEMERGCVQRLLLLVSSSAEGRRATGSHVAPLLQEPSSAGATLPWRLFCPKYIYKDVYL